MQLKKLLTEEQAVSSVIATILMVAVVVILAALIGTFVLGLGSENAEVGPSASISIEASDDYYDTSDGDFDEPGVEIRHNGGDSIPNSTVQILINDRRVLADDGSIDYAGDPNLYRAGKSNASTPTDPWESGESYVIVTPDDNTGPDAWHISDGDTVRVVWQSQNTNQTATIAKDTISL